MKSYMRQMKTNEGEEFFEEDEEEMAAESEKIDAGSLKEITPAQCFIDNKAMTTIFLPRIYNDGTQKHLVKTAYLITSDKEKIKLESGELMRFGYHSLRIPNHENRWSVKSVKEFLQGKSETATMASILETIEGCYSAHTDFGDKRWNQVISLWVIGTYFHRAFSAYPYIHLNGNMASGKSKTMLLSMLLAFNGEMSVNSTASYLTRTINDNNSSCGMDESEKFGNKDDNHIILAVVNAGYKKGTYIGKSEPSVKNGWSVKRFDAYSPKMFSGIKRLASTLASRSIPITMVKTGNKEIKNSEVDIEHVGFQEIRDSLYLTMMENHESIICTYKELEDSDIVGREFELWRPLLAIAKSINDALYVEIKKFALEIQEQKKEMIEEDGSSLKFLESIFLMTTEAQKEDGFFTIKEIQDFLSGSIINEHEESINPNAEAFNWMRSGKSYGRWIGDELRKTGVINGVAVQKKVAGENRRGFYLNEKVIEAKLKIFKED